jgi:hypothetical protein
MPVIGDVPGSQNILIAGGSGVTVTITSPTTGSTITTPSITVNWTSTPTSVAYRVYITRVSDNVIVLDTGYRVASISAAAIDGLYEDGEYYVAVSVYNLAGDEDPDAVQITWSGQSFWQVSNLTAVAVGMKGKQDTKVLPRVILTWSHSSLNANSTARVWRSEDGGDYIMIATGAQSGFEDATVVSGSSYTYFVVPTMDDSKLRKSNISNLVRADFEHCFIHAVQGPLSGVTTANARDATFVRFESWEHEESIQTDFDVRAVAGRRTPLAKFGENNSRKFSLRGLPQERQNGYLIAQLTELLRLQSEEQYTLCMRIGRDKSKIFGAFGAVTVASTQVTATASIDFVETFYSEDRQLDPSLWREL